MSYKADLRTEEWDSEKHTKDIFLNGLNITNHRVIAVDTEEGYVVVVKEITENGEVYQTVYGNITVEDPAH